MQKPPSSLMSSLADPNQFTLTFELVPSRGGRSKELSRIVCLAKAAAKDGRIKAVSITENAGGHPALSPEVLGLEIKEMGLEVITHFSCKDKNRNQMESLLFAWDREELHNLLVLSGDYPKEGFAGHPKPVFDLDSVQVLKLIDRMNRGRFDDSTESGPAGAFQPTAFICGVAVSPFKLTRPELAMQYLKLLRKAAAGADYAITQLGFSARKFHEALLFVRESGLNLPLLGNVFIPNLAVARMMNRGGIPGCIVPDRLLSLMEKEAASPDKGRRARLARAAKLLAILKGMGYSGAHIGGPGLTFTDLDTLLTEAESLRDDWRELLPELDFWPDGGAFLYEIDPATGLNLPVLATDERPAAIGALAGYRLARLVHDQAFAEGGLIQPAMKKICLGLADTALAEPLAAFEHVIKFLSFGCQNCGDCALADLAFLCPQSGCAKYLLNGPCGGSNDGWCEVYPGRRRCLYVRLHERLAAAGLLQDFGRGYVPPRDWRLHNTSSWVNFFQGKDHAKTGG